MADQKKLLYYNMLPKSGKEALALGLRRYFTGIPCINGHVSERTVRKHYCRECRRIAKKEENRRWRKTPGGRSLQKRKSLGKELKIRQATPKWVNRSLLNEVIGACPPDCHIDHILPLRGKVVCGLHVPENLQYLPAQENLFKSNKVDPLTLDYAVCVLPGHRTYVHT
jgi:hypothetical protein